MNFSNTEESFVLSSLNEFVKVWGSGGQSNLSLECRDGLACIKLSFNLGHPTSPHKKFTQYSNPAPAQHPIRRRNGPARQLKNIERAKAHKARLVAEVAADTAANQPVTDDSSVAADAITLSPTSPLPAPPQPPPSPPPQPLTTSLARDPCTDTSASTTSLTTPSLPAVVTAAYDVTTPTEAAPASLPPPSTQADTPVPVPVYCIATFENCPDEELSPEYADSLRRYLASEDHLCRNISSAMFKHVSTRRLRSRFVHTVEVVLQVKIERLWENAANYIRKHLGASNEWSRGNGTIIKLSRIHQT